MFRIKINKKEPTVPRCVVHDLIVCNLPDADDRSFYVQRVTEHGVIFGNYLNNSNDGATLIWPYGENYDILCSIIPENWAKF